MTLKQRIEEIAIDLAYWSYHNTVLEDYKDTDKKVEKATTDILKAVEGEGYIKKSDIVLELKKLKITEFEDAPLGQRVIDNCIQVIEDMKERLR